MKTSLLASLIFLSSFQSTPYDVEKLKEMTSDVEKIENYFRGNIYSETIDTFVAEFKELSNKLLDPKISESIKINVFNQLESIYTNVSFAYQVIIDIEYTKSDLEQEYFNLWNQNFILKNKIDKMYVITRKSSTGIYVEAEGSTRKTIRKKPVYESGIAIYENLLIELKNTNQCDFESRILVLEDIALLLKNMEKIAMSKNTKALEKSLKSKSPISTKKEILLNDSINL